MLRASRLGAVDFAKFDPRDRRHWQRLDLVIADLGSEDLKEVAKLQHQHWVTLASAGWLSKESREVAVENADKQLAEVIGLYFPALKEHFKKIGRSRDDAVEQFREIWGYPGEPKYEQMLQEQADAWKKISEGWKKRGLTDEPDLSLYGIHDGAA